MDNLVRNSRTGNFLESMSEQVSRLREQHSHIFAPVTFVEGVLFTVSEIGEVADAMVHNDKFARNDPSRERNLEKELGGVLFMIVSTLNATGPKTDKRVESIERILSTDLGSYQWISDMFYGTIDVIYDLGLDPEQLLRQECERLDKLLVSRYVRE